MRGSAAWTLVLRLVGCAVVAALAGWKFGPAGLAISSVLFGVVLARPLIDVTLEGLHLLRHAAYADIEGQHYAYRGTPVRVVEDEDHHRWVRLADLREVLGNGASDAALARLYGGNLRRIGWRRQPYLSAETLMRHLSRDTRNEAGRFMQWLERDVVKPARVLQERRRDTQRSPLSEKDAADSGSGAS